MNPSTPSTTLPVSPWAFLAPPQQPDEIGRLAQYRVLKPLGAGGMGMVFQAEDTQLRRQVALKVMKPDYAADAEGQARFVREAQLAAALKHDHIVTIYQVGEDRGAPFLAMELLAGKSLDEWLRPDRRATVSETLIIGKQIARGLAAAHKVGLVHRDIKPANLWIEAPHGRIKILDFGLARRATGDFTALTQDGAMLGTPAFMAPEQARGEPIDARCDLFSLGCVFYRMTTGRLPFQGNSLYAVLTAVATETPADIRTINPQIPERLAALMERLLAKAASDRPDSAQAVLDELLAIERELKDQRMVPPPIATDSASSGAVARPLSVTSTPARPRLGLWIGAGGLLAAAMTAIIVAAPWRAGPEPIAGSSPSAAGDASDPSTPGPLGDSSGSDHVHGMPATPGLRPLISTDAAPASVDISALIDIDRDRFRGTWHHLPEQARVRGYADAENDWFGLVLPWQPPASYRLKFRVARIKNGDGQFVVGLAQGDARFNLFVDFPHEGRLLTGINNIDGATIVARSDPFVGRVLPDGLVLSLAITVEPNGVKVEQNGYLLYSCTGDLSTGVRPSFQSSEPLQIGGWYPGDFAVEEIVLEPLTDDRGRPLYESE